jgi:hypothetical protein
MPLKTLLDMEVFASDMELMLDKLLEEVAEEKRAMRGQRIINSALKGIAMDMLPEVQNAFRKDTGTMAALTAVRRITKRGGGWRIGTPRRRELKQNRINSIGSSSQGSKIGEGYYPMHIEYGFKDFSGDFAMKRTLESNRTRSTSLGAKLIRNRLEKKANTIARKQNRITKKIERFS